MCVTDLNIKRDWRVLERGRNLRGLGALVVGCPRTLAGQTREENLEGYVPPITAACGHTMDVSDNKENSDTTPAPPLSVEFLSGGTAAGLEKIRARLLDLTNRNRLLNFRHTRASSIRIVDADTDARGS